MSVFLPVISNRIDFVNADDVIGIHESPNGDWYVSLRNDRTEKLKYYDEKYVAVALSTIVNAAVDERLYLFWLDDDDSLKSRQERIIAWAITFPDPTPITASGPSVLGYNAKTLKVIQHPDLSFDDSEYLYSDVDKIRERLITFWRQFDG